MRKRSALFILVASLLIMIRGDGVAQEPGSIIFWSAQGPVAVERISGTTARELGPSDAERLLQKLLEGPSVQEKKEGLWTAIPQSTTLLGVLDESGGTLIVRLDVPPVALQNLDHRSFEIIVSQIGHTLVGYDWRDLRVQVKNPASGAFVALADFLPPVEVPGKSPTPLEQETSAAQAASDQPPAPGQAQPVGALTGKTVYVSAGHGWQWVYSYSAGRERWETQRPPYPNSASYDGPIIEDHNNAEAVNQYLLHYLWNAGAMVWTARERDMNPNQVIVDDVPGTGFAETGWTVATGGYEGQRHRAETVTGSPTATASWRQSVPADGRYGVYVWYRSGADADRTSDARYTIHHAGGETTVRLDQRSHGRTWHYIGTYGFLAGEEARVTLTNQSNAPGKTVVADAVRFGGGTFDDLANIGTGADAPPYKPWWEIASFYYTQRMGMDAAYGDVTARPVYARWEHAGTGDDAVYVSWHTNGATGYQWSYSGTETYAHNGEGLPRTEGSLQLRQAIHQEVVHDIRAGWDASWVDRGEKQRNLGELRLLWDEDASTRMPGALIEIGFHDHPGDTDALKEPAFNRIVARAIYQGIAKYFNPGATLLPEPPTHLAVQNAGAGSVRVCWEPPLIDSRGLRGDAAGGYRVYTSTNGIGWSNGLPVSSGTDVVLTGLSSGQLLFVRVTAVNVGGESFPTETLATRVGDSPQVLLVNGFDRLNRTMILHENDPVEGPNARMLLDRMNRYDYVIQHGQAIEGLAFDSASNEAVQSGQVDLGNYAVVDWILGEESVPDETLSATERARLRGYLENGGALFISGTEIGWHLDSQGADPWFYNNVLRADYTRDDAETYLVGAQPGSIFDGLAPFRFDASDAYDADFPDVLAPINGSSRALVYQAGAGGAAATQYVDPQNSCQRLVYFGFPFETVTPQQRPLLMSRIMGFLGACLNPAVDTFIGSPSFGAAYGTLPAFEGTAQAQQAPLAAVEIQVQDRASGEFWDGSQWVTTATWLEAVGNESWSYVLPASLPNGDYRLKARARTTTGIYDSSPAETIFGYDTMAPSSTALISPTGGTTISALPELALIWQAVASDEGSDISYLVRLDGIQHPTARSIYTTSVTQGPHTWGVQVIDAAGNTSDWVTDSFTVARKRNWLPVMLRRSGGEEPPCSDLIVNGGFETDAAWQFNGFANYDGTHSHGGQRSALVGYDDVPYSSVRQQIKLPKAGRATLRLWIYPISEGNDPNDWHYVSLWDERDQRYNLELTTSDSREWRQGEYDLTDFMDQTVTIIVGASNDGDGNLTRAYVDDLELEICP